jgi:hypothetical protein
MSLIKRLAFASLAAITLPALSAQPNCPGNVASLPFNLASYSQIILPVVVNHAGPYDFLLDTGTQFTMVDPSLAAQLHLKIRGSAEIVGVGFKARASLAYLELLEAGPHLIANHPVEVQNLQRLQTADLHIRGILGGDFLRHFDVLIDYAHLLLCLDDANAMRPRVKGVRIRLVPETGEAPLAGLLILPVSLSGAGGARRVLLALDSGTNVPFLYEPDKYLRGGLIANALLHGRSGDGTQRGYSLLPPQNMQVGSLNFQQICFVTPARSGLDAHQTKLDGLLATSLFRSVFISYSDRFVVLEPR